VQLGQISSWIISGTGTAQCTEIEETVWSRPSSCIAMQFWNTLLEPLVSHINIGAILSCYRKSLSFGL